MAKKRSFSDKFWNDKHGKFVVFQKPNLPLWIWIVTTVISFFLTAGTLAKDLGYIGKVAIIIWAIMEVIWGVNYFRRLLGLGVLLLPLVIIL